MFSFVVYKVLALMRGTTKQIVPTRLLVSHSGPEFLRIATNIVFAYCNQEGCLSVIVALLRNMTAQTTLQPGKVTGIAIKMFVMVLATVLLCCVQTPAVMRGATRRFHLQS